MMGNVEVYIDGEWGYVCDDDWDLLEATVVCNQLGYTGVAQALSFAPFGFGNGTLHLDNLACFGNEASLQDCNASDIHDCGPFEAAGVICSYPGKLRRKELCVFQNKMGVILIQLIALVGFVNLQALDKIK